MNEYTNKSGTFKFINVYFSISTRKCYIKIKENNYKQLANKGDDNHFNLSPRHI